MGYSFAHEKINKLLNDAKRNEDRIDKLSIESQKKITTSYIKRLNKGSIDTTPVYYDLYNFLGTTYATGTTSPTPASAYIASLISGSIYSYTFKYPVYGFAVPDYLTPEDITDGATPWEFQTKIAVIKTIVELPNLSEWMLDGTKIISYLYNEDGSVVTDLKFIYLESGQNLDEQSVDFSTFHRWIKTENGFNLEYNAIYPIPENHDLSLVANLYMYNPKNDNYAQQIKI